MNNSAWSAAKTPPPPIFSSEQALDYAAGHGVPVDQTTKDIYSRDGNLWHLSHEGAELENPWTGPQRRMFQLTTDPREAPDEAQTITIGYDSGRPVSLDGEALGPVELVLTLSDSESPVMSFVPVISITIV